MNVFIRDWEVVSPIGVGRAEFVKGAAARCVVDAAAPSRHLNFDNFDKKAYLGKKGVRGMDTLGAYATVASELLVRKHPHLVDGDRSRVGVVLGTGTGSVKSHVEFIRDLHVQEQVEWVDPIQFPQTVMNCAAGQISIWHRLTGVNSTVSSGHHSGVTAFEYAANALRHARVDSVLAGCAEEYSSYSRFLLPVDARDLRRVHCLGEGCAMFLVEAGNGEQSQAEVFGLRRLAHFSRYAAKEKSAHLLREIDAALAVRGASAVPVGRICFNRFSPVEAEIVETLADRLGGDRAPARLCSNDVLADCVSATAGLQVCLLLALGAPPGSADCDLCLTFDPAGGVSMSLLMQK